MIRRGTQVGFASGCEEDSGASIIQGLCHLQTEAAGAASDECRPLAQIEQRQYVVAHDSNHSSRISRQVGLRVAATTNQASIRLHEYSTARRLGVGIGALRPDWPRGHRA
jgi:hypothetical protein